MDQAGTKLALCTPSDGESREGEQAQPSADSASNESCQALDERAIAQLRVFFQLLDRLDRRMTEDPTVRVEQKSSEAAGSAG
jgi:hypothetical protein